MSVTSFEVLEFSKLRTILAGFCLTPLGQGRVAQLAPLPDQAAIAEALAECAEMVAVLALYGRPPLGGCGDLQPALVRARAEGSCLRPDDLLGVRDSLRTAVALRRFFNDGDKSPRLTALATQLEELKPLREDLDACFAEGGEIKDSASFELDKIRRKMIALRGRIRQTLDQLLSSDHLAPIFQERLITERNGRYVVPIKADFRGRLKGFVHDESASGQTLFIEPADTLALNNDLHHLQRAEQREIERILLRLTAAVHAAEEALLRNQQVLAHLDLRSACGEFSRRAGCMTPQLATQPLLELKQARHPLLIFNPDCSLRGTPVIPVDLLLTAAGTALIISGPNTGGKTVALKTAGLLTLMVRAGLPIPCAAESRIYPFRRVFADIGDEQSIEEQLSTFSGHLVRLREILAVADAETLVLLDEVGTGTDPAEGGALALATLDRLREVGARTIATTHLQMVKSYALLHDAVENAAVDFDAETLAPTYRLNYGVPGASSAFVIAARLGLPAALLDQAATYLHRDERESQHLLERLHVLQKTLTEDVEETRKLRAAAQRERDKRHQLLTELEAQRQEILAQAREQGQNAVHKAEQDLRSLLRNAATQTVAAAQRTELTNAIRKVADALPQPANPVPRGRKPRAVVTGERLLVSALNAEGVVVSISGEMVELSIGGKKVRQPLAALRQFEPRRFTGTTAPPRVQSRIERDIHATRLLLVGLRVDEALPRLERFLDDALQSGNSVVEIVHGAGEGILRKVVREQLSAHRSVTSFYAAPVEAGGDNITIAELNNG